MCYVPHFKELSLRVGPSFWFKPSVSNSNGTQRFQVLQKHYLGLELRTNMDQPSNSSKLGTCQGQNSYTLGYHTPFQKPTLSNMCGFQMISRLVPYVLVEPVCFHVKAIHIQKHQF